jgi:hypothetical protein
VSEVFKKNTSLVLLSGNIIHNAFYDPMSLIIVPASQDLLKESLNKHTFSIVLKVRKSSSEKEERRLYLDFESVVLR